MSRTTRFNNGLNNGRDDKPYGAKCAPTTKHPKGYNTREDDHGHYGAGGAKRLKKRAAKYRRLYYNRLTKKLLQETPDDRSD